MQQDHKKLDPLVERNINSAFEVYCFVLMKYGPASGLGLTSARQPTKKRESKAKSKEKSLRGHSGSLSL